MSIDLQLVKTKSLKQMRLYNLGNSRPISTGIHRIRTRAKFNVTVIRVPGPLISLNKVVPIVVPTP